MWNAQWYFPAGKDIRKESINNAAMEIFRDNPIYSLAREICQNSLDAVDNKDQPVLVEFQLGSVNANQFPGKDFFLDVVLPCAKNTWSSQDTHKFLDHCHDSLNSNSLTYLRISDFNTKGLQGANGSGDTSPWKSLIEEVGSSIKHDDTSSGSFGIGKAAPFVCSGLRTVFYNTKVKNEGTFAIGVSNFVSFDIDADLTAQGVGYYGINKKPLEYNISFDKKYYREHDGTDIYVMDFNEEIDWKKQTILSIIENFLVSIYKEKLTVKVGNVEINNKNLGVLISEIENKKRRLNILNYYEALTNEKHLIFDLGDEFRQFGFDKEDASLFIIKAEEANRSILMTRRAGMKIFEKKGISSSIQFTGVFHATGKEMNRMLKIMENPAHEKWVPSRFKEDPKVAERFIKLLYKYIKETILCAFQEIITEEVDAYGLGDFLPDVTSSRGKSEEQSNNIDDITATLVIGNFHAKNNSSVGAEDYYEDQVQTNIDDGDYNGPGNNQNGNRGEQGNIPQQGSGETYGNNQNNEDGERVSQTTHLRKLKGKYIAKIIEKKGIYTLLFKPDVTIKKGVIEIIAVGEQNSTKINIIAASHNSNNLITDHNRISINNIEKDYVYEVNFQLHLKVRMKLEVNIFEDK